MKPKVKKEGTARSLGPVADLEKHLPADWWRSIFNSVYLKTDADVVENSKATEIEIGHFLEIAKLKPSDSILDLCCGQGRHSLELAKRGFHFVSGIDRSKYLIRLAKSRAQKSELTIKFSEGDARKIRLPDQAFNCVMIMGNSFGYFEKEHEDLLVLEEVNRLLLEGGLLYLDVTDGTWMKEHFEKRSWEWIAQGSLRESLSSTQKRGFWSISSMLRDSIIFKNLKLSSLRLDLSTLKNMINF